MNAGYFAQHGDLSQIKIGELPSPAPSSHEILIKTEYAAVNHLDLFVLRGWPGLALKLPHVMGSDGAGVVVKIGSNVDNLQIGNRVLINPGIGCGQCEYCLNGQQSLCNHFVIKGEHVNGTFAEFFCIPEQNVMKIPDNISFEKAAAAPLTFLTAWRMLVSKAQVQPNDFVLVQGASGGVSIAAIQIAKIFGAKVIATTSSAEKVAKVKKIGADFVINYQETPDYRKYIYKEITHKQGIDIAVDSVGKATFNTSVKLLNKGGKLVTCGATTGPKVEIDIRNLFWKQISLIGSTMSNNQEFRQVMQLIFDEKLIPQIDSIFPLEQLREAEQKLEEGTHFGKILIQVAQSTKN
ncbi:MAG: zinc-binding dehydrogenase [Promethearchaeota archaeon]